MIRRIVRVSFTLLLAVVLILCCIGILLFALGLQLAPILLDLISWGSHWKFGLLVCGVDAIVWVSANSVGKAIDAKLKSAPNARVVILFGLGVVLVLFGIQLTFALDILNLWANPWKFAALLCGVSGLACCCLAYSVTRKVERKQKLEDARVQFFALLHDRSQSEMQRVHNADVP